MIPAVNRRTLQRRLRGRGLPWRRAKRIPMTPRQKRLRREWRRKHLWAHSVWSSVIWTDECRFQRVPTTRFNVWRTQSDAAAQNCTQPQLQAGGGSLMVWGACSADGIRVLVRVSRMINSKHYIDTLRQHFKNPQKHGHRPRGNALPEIPLATAQCSCACLAANQELY